MQLDQLKTWIKQAQATGHTQSELTEYLQSHGYKADLITQAFAELEYDTPPTETTQENTQEQEPNTKTADSTQESSQEHDAATKTEESSQESTKGTTESHSQIQEAPEGTPTTTNSTDSRLDESAQLAEEQAQEVSTAPAQEPTAPPTNSVDTATQPVETESLEQIGSKIDSLYQGDDNSHIYKRKSSILPLILFIILVVGGGYGLYYYYNTYIQKPAPVTAIEAVKQHVAPTKIIPQVVEVPIIEPIEIIPEPVTQQPELVIPIPEPTEPMPVEPTGPLLPSTTK